MMSEQRKYFAFGSNMDPDRMKERKINFSKREHAVLEGWRLKFNKVASRDTNEGYANIEEAKGNEVEGILYTIHDTGLNTLDYYEGVPNHYVQCVIKVKLDDGREEIATTYIANSDKVMEELKPRKYYLNHLLKGCDLISTGYCQELRKWETLD